MKRHIPGLHSIQEHQESPLSGAFLVRVARVAYRWHPQKPFLAIQFAVLEPKVHESRVFSGRLYCTPKALWKLNWFLRDFGYDPDLLRQDQVDEKALVNLRGIVRTSLVRVNGHSFQNLEAFAPVAEWETLYCESSDVQAGQDYDDGFQLHTDQ
jgi:hypothetical protein